MLGWKASNTRQFLILGSGIHETIVSRPESNTLVLCLRGGFLAPPASRHRMAEEQCRPLTVAMPTRSSTIFSSLIRAPGPDTFIDLGGIRVEIVKVTGDGRPLEVAFHFDRELEDSSFRWIRWQDGIYVPFKPPPVGETIILPAIRLAPAG